MAITELGPDCDGRNIYTYPRVCPDYIRKSNFKILVFERICEMQEKTNKKQKNQGLIGSERVQRLQKEVSNFRREETQGLQMGKLLQSVWCLSMTRGREAGKEFPVEGRNQYILIRSKASRQKSKY